MGETAPMRVAVVGAGNMGRNHLRVYGTLKHVDLVGVYDADAGAAAEAAQQFDCRHIATLDDVPAMVDAVSICSPTSTHVDVGLCLLRAGVHCLIEKPLATSEQDCLALIETARASNAKLLVGHIERFNPAVQQLAVLLDGNQTVQAIDAKRLSSVGKRITDVDVVALHRGVFRVTPARLGHGRTVCQDLTVQRYTNVTVGTAVTLRYPDLASGNTCDNYVEIQGTVRAVGTNAIWVRPERAGGVILEFAI